MDCKYPRVKCFVFEGSPETVVENINLCGWQEANAWLEYAKKDYKTFKVECYEN